MQIRVKQLTPRTNPHTSAVSTKESVRARRSPIGGEKGIHCQESDRRCFLRRSKMHRKLAIAFIGLWLTPAVFAQLATTTSLVGTVSDSSGKSIPGAKVTAVETGTADT